MRANGTQPELFPTGRESSGLRTRRQTQDAVADELARMRLEVIGLRRRLSQLPCQRARCAALAVLDRRIIQTAKLIADKRLP